MFDLGFEGCMHNGIPLMYDEDCPVSYAYFINDTYLRLHMLRGVNMKVKELVAPWNVDAVGSRVVWQGQWCLVAGLSHTCSDDQLGACDEWTWRRRRTHSETKSVHEHKVGRDRPHL